MDGVAALPPLRETIARHGLDARKRLGQHFLLDLNLTRRIARAAQPLDQGTVVEVGPGPGGRGVRRATVEVTLGGGTKADGATSNSRRTSQTCWASTDRRP